jgi:hypothetical protein
LEHLIFAEGNLGAEEEILERVLVEHPMDEEAGVGALEVDAIFLGAITVKIPFLSLELSEFLGVSLVEVLREEVEFAQDLELEQLGQLGELGGATVVEDDLKHEGKAI